MLHLRAGELSAVNSCRAVNDARRAWLRVDGTAEIAGR
jgi:hypothetical protein